MNLNSTKLLSHTSFKVLLVSLVELVLGLKGSSDIVFNPVNDDDSDDSYQLLSLIITIIQLKLFLFFSETKSIQKKNAMLIAAPFSHIFSTSISSQDQTASALYNFKGT